MKIGDLVRINCDNNFLSGKLGVVIINEHDESQSIPYGLCVMLDNCVYGFLPEEIELVDEGG